MSIKTIDDAILAHRTWVARFQTAYKGINTEVFDLSKASDCRVCDLGRWLQTERSLEVLGQEAHDRIRVMHATFHEIAGMIADMLNRQELGADVEGYLVEFNNLSTQLVGLLMLAKKRF